MTAILAMLLISTVFLGPLAWRMWLDRRQTRADVVGAEVKAAIRQRFHGETMLSVLVIPRSLARAGHVVLSAPRGYEWLIEAAWRDVLRVMPTGYDVVLKGTADRAAALPTPARTRDLRRAA